MGTRKHTERALAIRNLTKHFKGVRAIDNLSLHLERGTITSIVGPNGSGKTTLINILSGTIRPDSGDLLIGNRSVQAPRARDVRDHGITRTFQQIRLFEQMTVLDNILVVLTKRSVLASLFETLTDDHRDQAKRILSSVNLWEKRNEQAANLSYGQRKLLEIARARASASDIHLLDEPFAGLFPSMVTVVFTLLKELKQEGKTVILVEHDMDLIRKISDWVIVMDSGTLLSQGSPEIVLSEQKVIDAYLGH